MNQIRKHFDEQLKNYSNPNNVGQQSGNGSLILDWFVILVLVTLAILIRIPFILSREFLLPGDEVMFGLMGNHILQGELPIFYWGQSYLGALEAYVTALFSLVIGMSGLTVQLGGFFFYILFLVTNYFLIKKVFNFDAAFFTTLLLVIAPTMILELSIRALGGYSEILFLGALSFLLWIKVFQEKKNRFLFPLGFTLGVALWLNSLFIMYLVAFGMMTFFWSENISGRIHLFRPLNLIFLRGFSIPIWLKIPFVCVHLFVLFYIFQQVYVLIQGPLEEKLFGLIAFKEPAFKWKGVKKILLLISGDVVLLTIVTLGLKRFVSFLNQWKVLIFGFLLGVAPSVLYSLFGGEGYRLLHGSGAIGASQFLGKLQLIFTDLIPRVLWGVQLSMEDGNLWVGLKIFMLILIVGSIFCYLLSHSKEIWNCLFFREPGVSRTSFFFCFLGFSVIVISFISSLVADRYLIAFYWVTTVCLGYFLSRVTALTKGIGALLIIPFLVIYLKSGYGYMNQWEHEDVEGLIEFLKEKQLQGGITDYDNSYRFTFYSNEDLVFIPLVGIIRNQEYKKYVANLNRRAFIFPANSNNEDEYLAANPTFDPIETYTYKTYRVYVVGKDFPLPGN